MPSTLTVSIIVILFSLTVNVKSQTCSSFGPSDRCSTNTACGCLRLSVSDEIGVCALRGVSCSRLKPCHATLDTCEDDNHICVHYSQCNSGPLCYPLSMVDQRLCPSTPATSTFPTTQFQETTDYSETTDFPTYDVATSYSGVITLHNDKFPTQNKHYQAIRVLVNTTGTYTFMSKSDIDTVGYLYQGAFYPENQQTNLATSNDDHDGSNQFRFVFYLVAGYDYTLVVTTFGMTVGAPFSIIVRGPDYVELLPIRLTEETSTPSWETTEYPDKETTQYPDEQTTDYSYMTDFPVHYVATNYSGILTVDSNKYPGQDKHYQAFRVRVNTSGSYVFKSESNMDTVGYLYRGTFYPLNQQTNLVAHNDDYNGSNQFGFMIYLEEGFEYTLVVTTYSTNIQGPFSVIVRGPDYVELFPIRIMEETSTASVFTTESSLISSQYFGALSQNSTAYTRSENFTETYYEAIHVTVGISGTYSFKSASNMDTYGALYEHNFIPSDPALNVLVEDDDGAGNGQFYLTSFLRAYTKYTLVITTFNSLLTGSFSIVASGPNTVYFN